MEYKKETLNFEFFYRNLWEWAMDLVTDPILAPHFHWDAQQLYKYNGKEWVRFMHEPWTADKYWRVQVMSSENAAASHETVIVGASSQCQTASIHSLRR